LPVALLCTGAGAAWAFLSIANEVGEGDTHLLDKRVLLALRNPLDPSDPLGPPWLEETARDFTALGSNGVLAFFVVATVLFLAVVRKRMEAVVLAATAGGAFVIEAMAKHWYDRPRPDLVPHVARVFTASFPSGHAAMSASVYLSIGAILARTQRSPRLKSYFVVLVTCLVLLIGVTRVYLGLHWPSDVVAGWMVGAGWSAVCWAVVLWLCRPPATTRI